MSAIKISELNSVETINNSDVLPIVNSNETKKISMEQIINVMKENLSLLDIQIVSSKDDVTQENVLYLVPSSEETNNLYDEYLLINGNPEMIGSTKIDLSNYPTKDEMNTAINTAIGGALDGSY